MKNHGGIIIGEPFLLLNNPEETYILKHLIINFENNPLQNWTVPLYIPSSTAFIVEEVGKLSSRPKQVVVVFVDGQHAKISLPVLR